MYNLELFFNEKKEKLWDHMLIWTYSLKIIQILRMLIKVLKEKKESKFALYRMN